LEAGFVGMPDYLTGKIRDGHGIKHVEAETKLKGKERSR
jgi:hypothetical protein